MRVNDVVFTNHAIERLKQRGISGDWAFQTVKIPDQSLPGKEKHTTEFIKKFEAYTVTAVAKKNDVGEWVVLSVWMDPPLPGTKDYHNRQKYLSSLDKEKKYRVRLNKASFWGKLWLTFLKQLGL